MATTPPTRSALGRFGSTARVASILVDAAGLLGAAFRVESQGGGRVHPGWLALAMGPIGVPLGYADWLATSILWIAWLSLRFRRVDAALVLGAVAIPFALLTLAHDRIPVGSSGEYPYVVGWGDVAWIGSMVLVMLAGAVGLVTSRFARRAA